jgi:hypothetical protein
VKLVCGELSPQSTSTVQAASLAPASVNDPRSIALEAPSSAACGAAAVTTGATFAIATIWTLSEPVPEAPSLSATFILTLAVLGPSGKEHWKLPPVAVGV